MYNYRDKVIEWLNERGIFACQHSGFTFASNFVVDIPDNETAVLFKFEFAHYYIITQE